MPPFSQTDVFVVYTEVIMVSFSKKSLHFQSPKMAMLCKWADKTHKTFSVFSWKWCCLNSPYLHNSKFIVITVFFLLIFHIRYLHNPKHFQIELGIVLISSKHDSEMLNFQPSIRVYLNKCLYCCVTNSFHQKLYSSVNGYASGQRKHCLWLGVTAY